MPVPTQHDRESLKLRGILLGSFLGCIRRYIKRNRNAVGSRFWPRELCIGKRFCSTGIHLKKLLFRDAMLLLLRAAKFLLCCVLYRERMGSRPLHKNACECAKIKSCRRRRKEGGKKVETKAYFKIRLYQDDAEVQRFSNTAGNGMVADVICRWLWTAAP